MSETKPKLPSNNATDSHDAIPEQALPRQRRARKPWEGAVAVQDEQSADQCVGCDSDNKPRVPRRWDRFARLVGETGVQKLMKSRVTIFGLGGVGSYAAESLARSAVGHLRIVDFDDVCVTNVNRQVQAFPGTVGQSKCDLLELRLKAINPDASIEAVQAFYGPDNSEQLLSGRTDYVIDAIDNVTAKLHLLTSCLKKNIPVVSVGGSGARFDPTLIRVDDISNTSRDPLMRVVRKELRRRGFDTANRLGLPVVFSEEEVHQAQSPSWDESGFRCICPHGEDSPHECEKRRMIYGTASFVTGAFGMAAASTVVKALTD